MTFDDVIKDPDFKSLPPQEKQKVLSHVDSDYAALPNDEQLKVIGSLPGGSLSAPNPPSNEFPATAIVGDAAKQAFLNPVNPQSYVTPDSTGSTPATRFANSYQPSAANPSPTDILGWIMNHGKQVAPLAAGAVGGAMSPAVTGLGTLLGSSAIQGATGGATTAASQAASGNVPNPGDVASDAGKTALLSALITGVLNPLIGAANRNVVAPLASKLTGKELERFQYVADKPDTMLPPSLGGPQSLDAAKAQYADALNQSGVSINYSPKELLRGGASKTNALKAINDIEDAKSAIENSELPDSAASEVAQKYGGISHLTPDLTDIAKAYYKDPEQGSRMLKDLLQNKFSLVKNAQDDPNLMAIETSARNNLFEGLHSAMMNEPKLQPGTYADYDNVPLDTLIKGKRELKDIISGIMNDPQGARSKLPQLMAYQDQINNLIGEKAPLIAKAMKDYVGPVTRADLTNTLPDGTARTFGVPAMASISGHPGAAALASPAVAGAGIATLGALQRLFSLPSPSGALANGITQAFSNQQ